MDLPSQADVVVIGGGAHGAWVARHAARAGLDVALFEKEDLASGTSSRSSMLAHGGLRYLAMGDFKLVREALQERGALRRMAPHLVRPLPFLLPFYRGQPHPGWVVAMGVRLYRVLAIGSGFPSHRILSRKQVLKLEPGLDDHELTGGALYYDGQILCPERLLTEVCLDASQHGASVHTRTPVTALDHANGRVQGVTVDTPDGEHHVATSAVLNTSGPWVEDVLAGTPAADERLRLTKGIHLVTPQFTRHAVVVTGEDGRVMFAIPWRGRQLVGTTDTDFHADKDEVWADADDVRYVQEAARRHFPDAPVDEVIATTAGLRNLLNVEGLQPSQVTREDRIEHHADAGLEGCWSLVGGKWTTSRRTGQRLLERAARHLDLRAPPLDEAPLPGWCEVGVTQKEAADWAEANGHARDLGKRLVNLLGARWVDATRLGSEVLHPDEPLLDGQVRLAAREEWAVDVVDVMRRRCTVWATQDQGRGAAEGVARVLEEEGRQGDPATWGRYVDSMLNW